MFRGVLEGFKGGPKIGAERIPDPLTFLVGSVFLIFTVPIGGIAEGIVTTYSRIRQKAE
ncbi:hypothetical protein ES703_96460 [subsurface metagenome]